MTSSICFQKNCSIQHTIFFFSSISNTVYLWLIELATKLQQKEENCKQNEYQNKPENNLSAKLTDEQENTSKEKNKTSESHATKGQATTASYVGDDKRPVDDDIPERYCM